MKSRRNRILLISFSLILMVWGLTLALLSRHSELSSLGVSWQTQEIQNNQAFFFLAGFDAADEAEPALYGEQKWRLYLSNSLSQEPLAEPSAWQFGIPCRLARAECLASLESQQSGLAKRLATDRVWLGRFHQLMSGEVPRAPMEPLKKRFQSVPKALTSAFELQIGDYISRLQVGDEQQQSDVFQDMDQHQANLLRHIEQTNLVPYRLVLLKGLREELAWLVAQLQHRPELRALAATHLQTLARTEHLAAPLNQVLGREFAHSSNIFTRIEQDGVSQALEWDLQVSSLFQTLTWNKNLTLNALAENYQYALELNQGRHGLGSLAQASEQWPEQNELWRDDNLIGALLLKDRLANLSHLLQNSLLTKAYYALARVWQIHQGQEQQLPESILLLGEPVGWQKRSLEKRLCLKLPQHQSLDDYCLRLSRPVAQTTSL